MYGQHEYDRKVLASDGGNTSLKHKKEGNKRIREENRTQTYKKHTMSLTLYYISDITC